MTATRDPGRVRVLTLNTGKGDGAYRERVAWMAEQLADLNLDLIALQESFICEDLGLDTARSLARALDMCVVVEDARRKKRWCEGSDSASASAMAILSRTPLSDLRKIELPRHAADGERIAQAAVFAAGGARLVVANVHLTHLPGEHALRGVQLDCVQKVARDLHGDVTLLCGDFNTTGEGPVLGPLLAPGCLADAWTLAGGPARRGTLVGPGIDGPCIDFVLVRRAEAGSARVRSARLALEGPRAAGGPTASDHVGVLVELEVQRRPHDPARN